VIETRWAEAMTRKSMFAGAAVVAALLVAGVVVVPRLRAKKGPPPTEPSVAAAAYRTSSAIDVAEVVLDGKLANGWDDWGWGVHEVPDAGAMRVEFGAYGGVIFHHGELPSRYGGLVFRYRASKEYDDLLRVSLKSARGEDGMLPHVDVTRGHTAVLDNGWYEVLVPWRMLNPSGVQFDRIMIQARRFFDRERIELDKIVLTKPGAVAPAPPASSVRKVQLALHCDRPAVRISPLIYGIAGTVWETQATAHRMGGNPMTRHNWGDGFWNVANDWFFENGKAERASVWLDEARSHNMKNAIVVPTIGWVAKDATSVGFPRAKFAEQEKYDPYRPEAGNGKAKDGKPIRPGPPTETSIAAPPELIGKWVRDIRESDRAKGVRSVDQYILDNEPNLWNTTHRDVHPDPLTYDELLDRTVRYAKAIREADPDAVIAGPAEWGWTGYFYSAKDNENGTLLRLDRRAHGDVPLLAWYLRKLREYEKEHGQRLLDIVDVHFYPQVPGIYAEPGRTDPESAALRLRSTRALWDPEYKDESWINEPVGLIPRVRTWISENYPGRGISIGEWSFGAEAHMSGGLAVAEVLGRFGQQGITSAFYWLCPAAGTPAFHAFRAFRNYDGKGGAFLDLSVPTTEAEGVSVFASRDEGGSHVVAVLLNLQPETAADAEIDVLACGGRFTRRVFEYRDGMAGFVGSESKEDGGQKSRMGLLHERLEPYSIKVIDLAFQKPPAQ
jgi:hypothetical protein